MIISYHGITTEIGRRSGYTVIATCSGKNTDYVKSLGADHIFDYTQQDVGPRIRAFTENKLKLAWDTVSNVESARICSEALSSDSVDARYASFLANRSPRADVASVGTNLYTIWGEYFKTGQVEYPASIEDFEWAKRFMAIAEDLISKGRLKPHQEIVKEFGLEGVLSGLDDLKNGIVRGGKLVYRVADTP